MRPQDFNASIPHIFLYDIGGVQCITATPVKLKYDTIGYKTSNFQYKADTSKIYVNRNSNGLYEITVDVSVEEAQASLQMAIYILKNGVELDGSRSVCYTDINTQRNSVHITYVTELVRNDYIEIEAVVVNGTVCTVANSSRLQIKYIPTYGWNNNSGGRMQYSGGVMR